MFNIYACIVKGPGLQVILGIKQVAKHVIDGITAITNKIIFKLNQRIDSSTIAALFSQKIRNELFAYSPNKFVP